MRKMTKKKTPTPKPNKRQAIDHLIYEMISDVLLIALYRVMIINSSSNLGWLKSPGFVLFLSMSIALSLTIRIDLTIDACFPDNS